MRARRDMLRPCGRRGRCMRDCVDPVEPALVDDAATVARNVLCPELPSERGRLADRTELWPLRRIALPKHYLPGWATTRRYGVSVFQPLGYFAAACSLDTAGGMMTSSPSFQFTGVATVCLAVS